jgi:hypothetical protein
MAILRRRVPTTLLARLWRILAFCLMATAGRPAEPQGDKPPASSRLIPLSGGIVIDDVALPGIQDSALDGSREDAERVLMHYLELCSRGDDCAHVRYWAMIAAENGTVAGQQMLAAQLRGDQDPRNRRRAEFWERRARAALVAMGRSQQLVDENAPGRRDGHLDPSFYTKRCDDGDLEGCFQLAAMYADGMGVAKDDAKAAALLRKACEGRLARGCLSLGNQCYRGVGLVQSTIEAVTLWEKACDLGEASGCENASSSFASGEGVSKNEARAAQLLRRACALGLTKACSPAR